MDWSCTFNVRSIQCPPPSGDDPPTIGTIVREGAGDDPCVCDGVCVCAKYKRRATNCCARMNVNGVCDCFADMKLDICDPRDALGDVLDDAFEATHHGVECGRSASFSTRRVARKEEAGVDGAVVFVVFRVSAPQVIDGYHNGTVALVDDVGRVQDTLSIVVGATNKAIGVVASELGKV